MEVFTQKWAIVAFLEDANEGSTFYYTSFPLHLTLAGIFKTGHDGSWLICELPKALAGQKTFSIIADTKDMFGPNEDVAVMKIKRSPELMNCYNKIHNWLIGSGAVYNEPQYQGDGYLPHCTYQKSGSLQENETRQIRSVSIIDLYPNGDGYQRKILKTVKLE